MPKIILCFLLLSLLGGLMAQTEEDWIWGSDEQSDEQSEEESSDVDFIKVNYAKKDARLALMMSALVPGAGQFYADKTAITTYIFPAVEIGLIAAILSFQKSGDDKTDDFERYANQEVIEYQLGDGTVIETVRYDRERQNRIQNILINLNPVDIYEDSYFRLQETNSQHFYEDIGKYPHYVFGWADWYYTFATDASGADMQPIWYPSGHDSDPPDPGWVWGGNYPLWGDNITIPVENDTHASSAMRKKYVDMRNDAKAEYTKAHTFTFILALNHVLAGMDALRVTSKINRGAITDSGVKMQYFTQLKDNHLTPMLGLTWKF